MENIFYAVLALHIAGKPINEDTIRKVLNMAGVPVDEEGLKAMAAFVHVLQAHKEEKAKADERIVKFLVQELSYLKGKTEKLATDLAPFLEKMEKVVPTQEESEFSKVREETKPSVHQVKEEKPTTREKVKLPVEQEATEVEEAMPTLEEGGRYAYGVASRGEKLSLGKIGIEGKEVYTIPYNDICAIVHNCPAEPYKSDDNEIVKKWVRIHQEVLDVATSKFGTMLPLGFDSIIQSEDKTHSPEQVVKDWLKEDFDNLKALLKKIEGKDEYGVQVSYDPEIMTKSIAEKNEEVRKLKEEIASKSRGKAYMYRQKLNALVKKELEKSVGIWFKDFYARITKYAVETEVGKVKKLDREVMLMNLSCLVPKDKVKELGDELENIDNLDGFSVRFTGPWPPYSFVTLPAVSGKKE